MGKEIGLGEMYVRQQVWSVAVDFKTRVSHLKAAFNSFRQYIVTS